MRFMTQEIAAQLTPCPEERLEEWRKVIDPWADLGQWVFPYVLMAWILDQAEALGWQDPERPNYLQSSDETRAKLMLTVVAFCLARRIFDSDGIARACRSDASLRSLCNSHGYFPSPGELRSFQRRHQPLLLRLLAGTFLRALKHRLDLGGLSLPFQLEDDLRILARERLHIARHMDVDE